MALSGLAAALAWRQHWLDQQGATAALLLGFITWLAGAWQTALPLLVFFLLGSLFSRLPLQKARKKETRNAWQVLANGWAFGLFMMLQVLIPSPVWIFGGWLSMAVALSDTASSEWGRYFNGPTYNILTRRRVRPGLSGGISRAGTLAGLVGAAVMAMLYKLVAGSGWAEVLLITLLGFGGMLADSYLSARWQVKYFHPAGTWSDEPSGQGDIRYGLSWMTNNMVNGLSILIVLIPGLLIYYLWKMPFSS